MNKPEPTDRLVIQNCSDEFSFFCHVLPEYEEKLKEFAEPYCSTIDASLGRGIVAITIIRNYNPSMVTDYLLVVINTS